MWFYLRLKYSVINDILLLLYLHVIEHNHVILIIAYLTYKLETIIVSSLIHRFHGVMVSTSDSESSDPSSKLGRTLYFK